MSEKEWSIGQEFLDWYDALPYELRKLTDFDLLKECWMTSRRKVLDRTYSIILHDHDCTTCGCQTYNRPNCCTLGELKAEKEREATDV